MADVYETRPATPDDIRAMMTYFPTNSLRAWSVFKNGDLVAIAGVALTNSLMLAFCEIKPEARAAASHRVIWRHALEIWGKIRGLGYRSVYAEADASIPGASSFLRHLGFQMVENSVRGEIYKWQDRK